MEAARAFAGDWVSAWHSRDIDAILSHYSKDIKFYSPRVKARYEASGVGNAQGVLTGKDDLRIYFQEALDKLKVIIAGRRQPTHSLESGFLRQLPPSPTRSSWHKNVQCKLCRHHP